MSSSVKDPQELQAIYERRFSDTRVGYRRLLWSTLVKDFFQPMIPRNGSVLDLGCGYGEFINAVQARERFAMDLNPKATSFLDSAVKFIAQDCTRPWALPEASLDAVFTSNFFEHLPDKMALKQTLLEARRCLKPGGRLIALGPNIKYVQGAYWDFWDHFLCLTELSLGEALENNGYTILRSEARFLPYTTVGQPTYPMAFVRLYLKCSFVWPLFGRQFLVVAEKR